MNFKSILFAVVLLAVVGIFAYQALSSDGAVSGFGGDVDSALFKGQAVTVYKTVTCGCCGNYVTYLERNGMEVEAVNVPSLGDIKKQYNIPADMQSCHTTVVGDYVVEGHIPVEAISKLLAEKPAIRGIAMPGMPSGSPGMPGPKEPFLIYELTETGKGSLFLEL